MKQQGKGNVVRPSVVLFAILGCLHLVACDGHDKQREDIAAMRKMMEDEQAKKASEAAASRERMEALRAKASESARKSGITK